MKRKNESVPGRNTRSRTGNELVLYRPQQRDFPESWRRPVRRSDMSMVSTSMDAAARYNQQYRDMLRYQRDHEFAQRWRDSLIRHDVSRGKLVLPNIRGVENSYTTRSGPLVSHVQENPRNLGSRLVENTFAGVGGVAGLIAGNPSGGAQVGRFIGQGVNRLVNPVRTTGTFGSGKAPSSDHGSDLFSRRGSQAGSNYDDPDIDRYIANYQADRQSGPPGTKRTRQFKAKSGNRRKFFE